MLPSTGGGANWPGGAFDPETSMIYVHSSTVISPLGLVPPKPGQSDMRFVRGTAPAPGARSRSRRAAAKTAPISPCRDCRW